jgi:hypothetical protein
MAYTVRFESNAFQADSAIGRMLGTLNQLRRGAQRIAGVRVQEFEGDELRRLYGVNQRTLQQAMDWADSDFDAQMTMAQWNWKGPDGRTRRRNGQVVSEPRNIVDTGELMASKQRTQVNRNTVDFTWTADHAEQVHDGGVTRNGEVNPARPWTEPTLANIDDVINSIVERGAR